MKYLKFIICTVLILFVTGCSVEYNLNINDDKSVSEKVIASENTNKMQAMTRLKGKQAIGYLYDMYKRKNTNSSYTSREGNGITYVTTIATHNTIEEYSKKFSSDIFDNIILEKNDNIVRFICIQKNKLTSNESNSLIYDNITVKINIPFEVTYSNADNISGNTYTWYIKKDQDLKSIEFTYDEEKLKNKITIKINNKTYDINFGLIIVSGIIVLLLIVILIVVINNRKNNVV